MDPDALKDSFSLLNHMPVSKYATKNSFIYYTRPEMNKYVKLFCLQVRKHFSVLYPKACIVTIITEVHYTYDTVQMQVYTHTQAKYLLLMGEGQYT